MPERPLAFKAIGIKKIKKRVRKAAAEEVAGGPYPWQSLRKAKVARAKKLVRNPDYPPKNVLNAVAKLLARHGAGDSKNPMRKEQNPPA